MATQKFKAVAELFLDTRDAESDAKQFVQDVKKQLKDLENAADKVTVFKDFVGYIAQIDKNLSELKAKNADTFKHMFDGLDGNMRQMLESLFGVSGDQLGQVDALRNKLATLTPKSTVKDIKAFAGEINQLFRAMGKESPIALQDITASTKADTIQQMTQALENFAAVWQGVNKKVAGGFTFGGTGGGSGSDGESPISAEVQAEIDKITTQIDELKRAKEELQKVAKLQSTIKSKGSSAIPDSIEAYTTTEAVQDLITEFDALEKELASGDKASADYANKLIKMSNIILTLQKSLKAVRADNTIKDLFQAVGSGQGDSMLGALSKYVNNKSLKYVNEIVGLGTIPQMDAKILDLENEANYLAGPYDVLNEKLHEYIRLQEQMDSASGGELKSLYAQSDALREYIIALGEAKKKAQEVEDVFDNLFSDDDGLFAESDVNNALEELCNILGVQLPGAVNKAKDAFGPEAQSGKTSDGPGGSDGAGAGNGADFEDKIEVAINSEQLEQSISGLTGKLNTLSEQVHISTQEITDSASQLKTSVDNLTAVMQGPDETAQATAERDQQIEYMKQNLLDMFKRVSEHNNQMRGGYHTQQETTTEFFADGTARFGYGEKGTVPWEYTLQNVLSNILSKSIMSVHSHPWGDFYGAAFRGAENSDRVFSNDAFSSSTGDLAAWMTLQRYGSQIGAMLTGNILRTFDTSKIGDKYRSFISNLGSVEDEYAQKSEYAKYFNKDTTTGKISLNHRNDLMGWQEAANTLREVMFEALRRTGFSDSDIQGIYQEYDLTNDKQLTNLASTLVDLSVAAQSADSHVDALKGLLMEFGTSTKKDDIYSQWKRLSDDILNGNTLFAQDDFDALRDQIRDYGGNAYDTELDDIFSKYVNTGEFTKAANEIFDIIKTFGKDIESQEGQVALESLRKGELTAAEVWNKFSDFAKLSQEAIDNAQVIDAEQTDSAETQLMSQMAGSLAAIEAQVASIEANTRPTMQEQLDSDAQKLMQIVNANGSESVLRSLFNGQQSIFDKDNVTDFKAQELYKIAEDAAFNFRQMLDNVKQSSAYEDVAPAAVQQLFDQYAVAVQRTLDASQQIAAFESRYGTDLIHDQYGTVLRNDMEGSLSILVKEGSSAVSELTHLISNARQSLVDNTSLDRGTPTHTNNDFYSNDNSDLGAVLRTLAGAIDSLVARLGGVDYSATQFEPTGSNALGDTGNIDLSSEIAQCTDLLDILGRIKFAVEAKTEAFEEEKATVNRVVVVEEDALEELKGYVDTLRDAFKTLFENLPKDDATFEVWKNDIIVIKNNLDGVLQDLRDINDLAPQNGPNVEAPELSANDTTNTSEYALENTLQATNGILEKIFGVVSTDLGLINKITTSLSSAADELKKVSNGIIEEHKRKKVDTSAADARLADSAEVADIQQAALDAVSGRMMSGGKSAVTGMTAMKDGVVKVTGWIQTATDAWEGFTVQVNEANQASKTAYDLSAKAARQAAAAEKEDNPYEYDKAEVEARARKHLDEYTAEGKKATVQFKDSGRYTITVLEEIDGLSKQIFQTFDENDAKIERTTATMSNAQKIKLEDLKKTIDAGVNNSHVGNEDTIYKQYKTASDELERMNALYQTRDDLSGEEILNWNAQIKLVQQLGSSVESLINKRKVAASSDLFKSERGKKLSKFDLDKAELVADINIPDSFNQQLDDARKKIENAVDDESLKIAINEWEALKNQIKQTATEQDLYIKKTKEAKNTQTPAEKAAKDLEKSRKLAPANALMAQVDEEMRKAGINPKNRDLTGAQAEIKKIYDDLIAKVNEYRINVQYEQQVELSGIEAIQKALYGKIDAYKKDNHIIDARKSTFGATTTGRIVGKYEGLKNVAEKDFANSDLIQSKLKQYTDAIEELKRIQGQFNAGEKITGDQEQEFNAARDACNKYGQELNKLIVAAQKSAASATRSDPLGADFVDDAEGRRRALQQYVEDTYGASAAIDKFTKDNNKLFFTIDNGDGTFSRMCAQINATRSAIDVTTTSTKKATGAFESFFNELKGKFKSIGAYLMASFSFQEVFQQVRKGVQYVREIDSALTELKKVTDETDAAYDKFLQSMSKTAGVVGSTVSNLTTMAAEWARLGYSMAESAKLAESTAILLNVSEFSDATQASEALISTMQAFQYTADESQHVVDILNEVGNNYAISSDGIATALQDSASALMEGGNNLEQATALVAAANRVVQDPSSVGSALRTISLRLRGTSVKVLEEMGEETEGVIESTSKLQSKIKALSGVNILTDSGDYKDTYTILKEIGQVWEDMSDIDQAALLELMAGE